MPYVGVELKQWVDISTNVVVVKGCTSATTVVVIDIAPHVRGISAKSGYKPVAKNSWQFLIFM